MALAEVMQPVGRTERVRYLSHYPIHQTHFAAVSVAVAVAVVAAGLMVAAVVVVVAEVVVAAVVAEMVVEDEETTDSVMFGLCQGRIVVTQGLKVWGTEVLVTCDLRCYL